MFLQSGGLFPTHVQSGYVLKLCAVLSWAHTFVQNYTLAINQRQDERPDLRFLAEAAESADTADSASRGDCVVR
ncbi:hypothetical protein N7528_004462 [Penicillium herquei]|nr:hypothetical protein N7528_004462 [Penicillium herquei]